MSEPKRNYLLLGNAFDRAFASFQTRAGRFKANWNERIHTIDDDRISPRVLSHWIKQGLIEDERPEGKGWHRFSSSDMFWVKTLIKLRKFGVPIETLKSVKKELEVDGNSDSKRPLLEYYIAYTFFEKKPARILVFSNGEALIASQEEIDTALQFGTIQDDFISIDINRMLGNLGSAIDYLNESQTEIEKAVSSALNDPEIRKVTIESRETKYVVKATQLMENRDAAIAAKQLHDFCSLQEMVHKGKSRFEFTTSQQIKKS
jgi:DNA-binding transcriptional MerR regulator